MPRPNRGPRPVQVKKGKDRPAYWHIRWYENGKRQQVPTGIPVGSEVYSGDPEEDPQARAIEIRRALTARAEVARPTAEFLITDALDLYGRAVARDPEIVDKARIGYALDALAPFWAGKTISELKGKSLCQAYARARERAGVSTGTVRRELGALKTALRHCWQEGLLPGAPFVWLPKRPQQKEKWLTRDQVAKLLRAARKDGAARKFLPWFILIAVYTGTRPGAVLGLKKLPSTDSGWIDLETGMLHRRGTGARETNKRQPPVPLPPALLAHLRRRAPRVKSHWVEWNGRPIEKLRHSFKSAAIAAGVEWATPHCLRHTAITWALQDGVTVHEVEGFYGVASDTMKRVYAHHHPDYLKGARDAPRGRHRGHKERTAG